MKRIKKRVLSIVITCAMMVLVLIGMPPMEVKAANFYPPIVDTDSIVLYESGCLKEITITVQTSGTYGTAYGRIGVHNGATSYDWNNRFISKGCTTWPDESEFKAKDPTFLTFANGEQFEWTDRKEHKVTVGFDDGDVDLTQTGTYYIYLWTISNQYGIYTDAKIGTLVTENGALKDSNGNTLADSASPTPEPPHTHSLTEVPAKAVTCTTDGNNKYYKCDCGKFFKEDGTTETTVAAETIGLLGHDMTDATCTEEAVCKRSGCDHTEDAIGHDWSGEWTVIKEATATEDGKKETLCTRGCGQKKVVIIPATGTTDDEGKLEKDTEVTPDAPIDEATLNNSKEELYEAGNIFDDTEKTLIENGADARVWLEISKTNESTIVSTDKEKVEQEAAKIMGDNVNITYFEADLFKQVGTTVTEIREPGVAIKITIKLPDELLNSDKKVSREYKIVRLHEGQVDVLNGTFNSATGEFTFETDKFSSYAIVYKDVAVNNPTPGNNNVIKPENDKKDEVPKTGESNTALYSFVFMLVSGLGVVICSRKKRF